MNKENGQNKKSQISSKENLLGLKPEKLRKLLFWVTRMRIIDEAVVAVNIFSLVNETPGFKKTKIKYLIFLFTP